MAEGYNFDGARGNPLAVPVVPDVARLGDTASVTSVYSVPNFYGAHGHDSELPSMSAILDAAGPSLKQGKKLHVVHNIDIAPTVLEILGVSPAPTVDGTAIRKILTKHPD